MIKFEGKKRRKVKMTSYILTKIEKAKEKWEAFWVANG